MLAVVLSIKSRTLAAVARSLCERISPFEVDCLMIQQRVLYQVDLLHALFAYQLMIKQCSFVTKMEYNREQSHPEQTITTSKHLRGSMCKYFGFYTVDGTNCRLTC